MMKYLLDVNMLVAWGWVDHSDHLRAARWIAAMKTQRGARLFTSAIPELGFVRVSVQRSAGRLPVAAAAEVLSGMIGSLGKCGGFVADDCASSAAWPEWCGSASRTTDAHLMGLAAQHGLCLATLDEGIPDAYLIPESVN